MQPKRKIKFANNFIKLHNQESATLLDVVPTYLERIDNEAIHYDTLYLEEPVLEADGENRMMKETSMVHANYPIPDVALLRLTFIGNKGIPFTTYRRLKKPDWKMYCENIKKEFKIVILDEEKVE